ncbi:putative mitogen-activated protein kinase 14C [Drosophila subobscura]|uniref:putative mitogen-activated protein kinase 14C n=1 Tax=Drosophila subobscura TaxID=7241 RepID=UPI00155B2E06|nr:putative mitogen-activated protein kinase 14C [Drosophila subobscura]
MSKFTKLVMDEKEWEIPEVYEVVRLLGAGSFGQVSKVKLRGSEVNVAIKKLLQPFETAEHAKRVYREIRLLKHMDHPNVISLLDIFHPPSPSSNPTPTLENFQQVYLVTHLMDADLHNVIRSQKLSHSQIKVILYQILRGLKYIHSAGVLHRDLKPGNIAVNKDCELRILDFGMARLTSKDMTTYVTTRWYRAPEILFCWTNYTNAIDMWSVGCIFAELITGRPLFPGRDYLNQLECIIDKMGTPSAEFKRNIDFEGARKYIESLPTKSQCDFAELFGLAGNSQAVDLIQKMLVLDPDNRITADEALRHPFLKDLVKPHHNDEDTAPLYDQNFENMDWLSVKCWKELVLNEIRNFRPPPSYEEALKCAMCQVDQK